MPTPLSHPFRVVFALLGDVRINSRAVRQLRLLLEMGAEIEVICYDSETNDDPFDGAVRFHFFDPPGSRGARYFLAAHNKVKRLVAGLDARVFHASDLYCLPALARQAGRTGGKLVFDSRELYPYVGYTSRRPWVSLFWHAVEARNIRRCDAVLTVNESIADRLKRTYGIPRPAVMHNVPDYLVAGPGNFLRKQTGTPPGVPIILYQGHLKPGRGCRLLIDAMPEVQDAVLFFMGDGELREPLERHAANLKIRDRVHFLPPVPPDRLLDATSSADIGACLIEDLSLSLHYALPNKLFEYLMAGLPVLSSDLPEMTRVVRDHDVGVVIDRLEPETISSALNRMLEDAEALERWKRNTPTVFETFNWETASQSFKKTYTTLLS